MDKVSPGKTRDIEYTLGRYIIGLLLMKYFLLYISSQNCISCAYDSK